MESGYILWIISVMTSDSCTINNGGCGANAICSHDAATFAVRCRCRAGYTNTGTSAKLNCTGKLSHETELAPFLHCCLCNADSCNINNGGCSANAMCTHDPTTNVVICVCKSGYTNTGSSSNVICTGTLFASTRVQKIDSMPKSESTRFIYAFFFR